MRRDRGARRQSPHRRCRCVGRCSHWDNRCRACRLGRYPTAYQACSDSPLRPTSTWSLCRKCPRRGGCTAPRTCQRLTGLHGAGTRGASGQPRRCARRRTSRTRACIRGKAGTRCSSSCILRWGERCLCSTRPLGPVARRRMTSTWGSPILCWCWACRGLVQTASRGLYVLVTPDTGRRQGVSRPSSSGPIRRWSHPRKTPQPSSHGCRRPLR